MNNYNNNKYNYYYKAHIAILLFDILRYIYILIFIFIFKFNIILR